MKCEIIKDLLPAYCDCVCSIETAAEIEQHTANCADCKKLLENYRSEVEPINKVEPEKPFRKIKRGIFRNKLVIAVLVILLAGILCTVGYLTYGQIVKEPNQPSFETIIVSQKAKKIVKKLCSGDIDYVLDNIEIHQTGEELWANQFEIRDYCRGVLTEFYETSLRGKKLRFEKDNEGYGQFVTETGFIPWAEIIISDSSNATLNFSLYEHTGGKFIISVNVFSEKFASKESIDKLNFALNPGIIVIAGQLEKSALNNAERKYNFFTSRFCKTDEEVQRVSEIAESLMKDVTCEDAYYLNFRFDPEKQCYLADMNFIFSENSSGKKIVYKHTVQVDYYYSYTLLDDCDTEFIDEGVSPAVREKIEDLFDI